MNKGLVSKNICYRIAISVLFGLPKNRGGAVIGKIYAVAILGGVAMWLFDIAMVPTATYASRSISTGS